MPVVVLADDLIWGTRLERLAVEAGARVRRVRDLGSLDTSSPDAALAIVDATARSYDPLDAIRRLAAVGVVTVCVAQHDDADLRRNALAAGAAHVVPYRTMAERGARLLGEWLRDEVKTR